MSAESSSPLMPIRLEANRPPRFYRGGPAIAELRGLPDRDDHLPEDWVGSTTAVYGSEAAGLSRLGDGRLLRYAVAADPEAFLGPDHVARFGADPALLVKLLDAGERLPVHSHPDRAFAQRWVASRYGKTEAWVVISARGERPVVHLGFRAAVDRQTLASWVADQDRAALLGSLNEMPVSAGDAIFVPAGLPHAIGAGVLITELQEPSDLSVILEWEGFAVDGARDGHLGLGFEVALESVDRLGELQRRPPRPVRPGIETLLPDAAAGFFRAERIRPQPTAQLDAAFSILVTTSGAGWLRTTSGQSLPVGRGDTILVPFGAGETLLEGDLEALRCLGPATN
jgi:mannose-6-phosphate isomerase